MTEQTYIGSVIVVAIFLLSQLGVAIWFFSKMSTEVRSMSTVIKEMAIDFKAVAEMNTRVTVLEQRMTRAETDMRETLKAAALLGQQSSHT